jgi:asparagine synthase (glutamine-hydrolysing)
VEIREPLADRRLLAFRAAIPEEQFLRNGELKWLVRRVMRGRLPERMFRETARGRQAADWFEAASASLQDLRAEVACLGENPLTRSLLDFPFLNKLTRDWPQSLASDQQVRSYARLVNLLAAGRFARRFDESDAD